MSTYHGGHIIEEDGTISIDNKNATYALELLGSYYGNITDPNCVTYTEHDVLNQFLSSNAMFVRGWYSTSLSYINWYTQGGNAHKEALNWNISRLPGYATLGGVSLAVNNGLNQSMNETNGYFDFAEYTTSINTSLYKWTQTQIIPPYNEFLNNLDENIYCNDTYKYGINATYFGSPINICSMDLKNLTTTYLGMYIHVFLDCLIKFFFFFEKRI